MSTNGPAVAVGLMVLAVCATLGCNSLAGTGATKGNGNSITYSPTPYQQLEDNLDMWEEIKADFLQDPEDFVDTNSEEFPALNFLSPEKVLQEINNEIAEIRRMKTKLAGDGSED